METSKMTMADVPDYVPEENRGAWLRLVNSLIEKATVPGNWAWQRLENEFGFVGDYQPADHGEAPKGAEW